MEFRYKNPLFTNNSAILSLQFRFLFCSVRCRERRELIVGRKDL
jgi:hypothetical protein